MDDSVNKTYEKQLLTIASTIHKYITNSDIYTSDMDRVQADLKLLYDKLNLLQSVEERDTLSNKELQLVKDTIVYYELAMGYYNTELNRLQEQVPVKYSM